MNVNVGNDEWNNGLFDCFSGGVCLKGTFCPCFVYGKTQHRIKDPSMAGYSSMNSDCFIWCGTQYCCGIGWIFNCMQRGDIRKRFGINGGGCTDCLASACCTCCVVIQSEKEVVERTSAGNGAGYVAPQGMMAQPQ